MAYLLPRRQPNPLSRGIVALAAATLTCAVLATSLRAAQPAPPPAQPELPLERDTRQSASTAPAPKPSSPPASTSAAAPAALGVKGDLLGTNLADFTDKYRREVHQPPHDPVTLPVFNFGAVFTAKDVLTQPSYLNKRETGRVELQVRLDYESGGPRNDTLGNIPADIRYFFHAQSLADWDAVAARERERREWSERERAVATNVLLGEIDVRFALADFDTMLTVLTQKYGSPSQPKIRQATYSSAPGVTFKSLRYTWKIGSDEIVLDERGIRIDDSIVLFIRPSVTVRSVDLREARLKAAVDDL